MIIPTWVHTLEPSARNLYRSGAVFESLRYAPKADVPFSATAWFGHKTISAQDQAGLYRQMLDAGNRWSGKVLCCSDGHDGPALLAALSIAVVRGRRDRILGVDLAAFDRGRLRKEAEREGANLVVGWNVTTESTKSRLEAARDLLMLPDVDVVLAVGGLPLDFAKSIYMGQGLFAVLQPSLTVPAKGARSGSVEPKSEPQKVQTATRQQVVVGRRSV